MRFIGILGFVAACALPVSEFDPITTSTTAAATGTAAPVTTTTDTTTTTTTTTTGTGPGGTSAVLDLPPPDTSPCDPYSPMSCPEGQKCVWLDGVDLQVARPACIPEPRHPIPVGEPCPPDLEYSGIDDCAAGSICVPFGSLEGTWVCTALCQGDHEHPYCGPLQVCVTTRTWAFCRALCSPLVQDCPDDGICMVQGIATGCRSPDQGFFTGEPGSICEWAEDCMPGSICVAAEGVSGCAGESCCAPLCSVGEDPVGCKVPGQQCQPLIHDGEPSLWPGLGVCLEDKP